MTPTSTSGASSAGGVHTPGPWGTSRQPGGLWIAVRVNGNCPGGGERLPEEGAFCSEAAALMAIAQCEGRWDDCDRNYCQREHSCAERDKAAPARAAYPKATGVAP